MKNSMMATLAIVSFLLVSGFCSARLLENSLFFDPGNPSAFDPNLNSVVADGSRLQTADGHVERAAVKCDEEINLWSSSSTENVTKEKTLSFRLSTPSAEKTEKKPQLPADSAEKAEAVFNLLPKGAVTPSGPSPKVNSMVTEQRLSVFNLLPKGSVTPSGPSPKVNSMVTEQRLSKSGNSPGVGHMQIFRHKSQHVDKSNHSNAGEKHFKQDKSNEQELVSNPSPGVGN